MKKLSIILALLLLAGVFAFADVTVGGELMIGATDVGENVVNPVTAKAEININASLDDYTSVAVELDAEGSDWDNMTISVDDWRVSTNPLGALGIDAVALNITAGLFDYYWQDINNWNYVSRSAEEYYYSTPAGDYLWNQGQMSPDTDLAVAFDLAFSDYHLMYWQDLSGTHANMAVSGKPVNGLNFLVGYYGAFANFGNGNLWVEGGYAFNAGPASLFVPASFTYDIDGAGWGWSSGVAADVDAYHFSVGVGGTSDTAAFADCLIELSTSVVENADIYVIADLDFAETDVFQSVDLGGKYNFGAFGFGAGYVIASSEAVTTILWGDNSSTTGSGLYLYADVDF